MDGHIQVSYDAHMHPHPAEGQTHHPASEPALVPDELASLREEFAGFRIWREVTGEHIRFVAQRLRPGAGPHTVVTADAAELRAALNGSAAARRRGH